MIGQPRKDPLSRQYQMDTRASSELRDGDLGEEVEEEEKGDTRAEMKGQRNHDDGREIVAATETRYKTGVTTGCFSDGSTDVLDKGTGELTSGDIGNGREIVAKVTEKEEFETGVTTGRDGSTDKLDSEGDGNHEHCTMTSRHHRDENKVLLNANLEDEDLSYDNLEDDLSKNGHFKTVDLSRRNKPQQTTTTNRDENDNRTGAAITVTIPLHHYDDIVEPEDIKQTRVAPNEHSNDDDNNSSSHDTRQDDDNNSSSHDTRQDDDNNSSSHDTREDEDGNDSFSHCEDKVSPHGGGNDRGCLLKQALPLQTVNQPPPSTVNLTPLQTVNQTPPSTVNLTPLQTVNQTPPSTVNQTHLQTFNQTPPSTVNQAENTLKSNNTSPLLVKTDDSETVGGDGYRHSPGHSSSAFTPPHSVRTAIGGSGHSPGIKAALHYMPNSSPAINHAGNSPRVSSGSPDATPTPRETRELSPTRFNFDANILNTYESPTRSPLFSLASSHSPRIGPASPNHSPCTGSPRLKPYYFEPTGVTTPSRRNDCNPTPPSSGGPNHFDWSTKALDDHMGNRSRHRSNDEMRSRSYPGHLSTSLVSSSTTTARGITHSRSFDDVIDQTENIVTSFMWHTHEKERHRRLNSVGHSYSAFPLEELGSPAEGYYNETDHDTMRPPEADSYHDDIDREFDHFTKHNSSSEQSQVAMSLIAMGDGLDNQQKECIDTMIDSLNIRDSEVVYETFSRIGRQLMELEIDDMKWTRIVVLLIFGYRLSVRTLQERGYASFFRKMIGFISQFLRYEHITRWIADNGGWVSVLQLVPATVNWSKVLFVVGVACVLLSFKLLNIRSH